MIQGMSIDIETERYVMVEHQRVSVSYSVQRFLENQALQVRRQEHKSGRCYQWNFHRCDGDCFSCPSHEDGILVSLDAIDEDTCSWFQSNEDVEETIIRHEMWATIYAIADNEVQYGALILKLYFDDGLTYRDISNVIGIDHKSVIRRMVKLLTCLKEHCDLFS